LKGTLEKARATNLQDSQERSYSYRQTSGKWGSTIPSHSSLARSS